jgi:hypothetical protein
MIVITDSNIIFSALYAPKGVISSILKNKGDTIISPQLFNC